MPADAGFKMPDEGIKGDVRCKNGFVVIWNYLSVQNILKIKAQHDARLAARKEQRNQPPSPDTETAAEYPRKLMRKYRCASVSWPQGVNGERPENSELTDEELHYQALYDAQDSAARRNLQRNAQIFQAHRLRKRGWSVERIARRQQLARSTVYEYLAGGLPTGRLLFTDELRERAEQDRQRAIAEAEQIRADLERIWQRWEGVFRLSLGLAWRRSWWAGSRRVALHRPSHTTPPTLFGQTGRRPQGRTRDPPESVPEPSGRSPPGLGAAQNRGKQRSRL